MSNEETLCYSLLENEVSSFQISIDDPFLENNTIDFSLSVLSSCNIDVNTSNDYPIINIELTLAANSLSLLSLTDTESVEQIDSNLKMYIESMFRNYLDKVTSNYNVDINQFYKFATMNFKDTNDFNNYNWNEKYEKSEFNISINLNTDLHVVQNM